MPASQQLILAPSPAPAVVKPAPVVPSTQLEQSKSTAPRLGARPRTAPEDVGAGGLSSDDMKEVFGWIDKNGDGHITRAEFIIA